MEVERGEEKSNVPVFYMLPEKICGIGLVYFRLVPAVSSFPGLDIPQVQQRSI
jgi:hypothetical protein